MPKSVSDCHGREPGHRAHNRRSPLTRFLGAGSGCAEPRQPGTDRAVGAEALVIEADLARPEAPQAVVDQTLSTFGRIDALLNIAGAVPQIDLFEMTDEQWDGRLGLKLHGGD